MRAVIQRVGEAEVKVESGATRHTGVGLLILLGIEEEDTGDDIAWLSRKITNLRIFDDAEGKMNDSVKKINGDIMVISQFTLHATVKKGTRPSFVRAASPAKAIPIYEAFVKSLRQESGLRVETGEFGDHMQIMLVNDGPVTIIIDSLKRE